MVLNNVVAPLRRYVDDKNITVQKIGNIFAVHLRVEFYQIRLYACVTQSFQMILLRGRSLYLITRFDEGFCQWQPEPAASENSDGFFFHESVLRLLKFNDLM